MKLELPMTFLALAMGGAWGSAQATDTVYAMANAVATLPERQIRDRALTEPLMALTVTVTIWRSRMKVLTPFVALLLVLSMSAAHAQTRMKIIAGPVKATGDTISGSFRVQESHGAGIVSNGTGGACLVAERSDHACGTDDDCGDLRTQYHPEGWAYCLDQAGVHQHKTCWVRPGADVDFCLKSPVAPLPLDTRIDLPQVDPRVVGSGHAIRWRVIACLNGYDAATKAGNRACGGHPTGTNPELMSSNGPARRVP
jgi:hypothetical protein